MIELALIGLALVQALAFAGILARQSRAHARREDLLISQLLHAVDKPWQPAPADERPEPEPPPEQPGRYTLDPEER